MPVEGDDELKRTNEIGMAIPLLDGCDLAGKDVTADALLTQRTLASYLVGRQAHYHLGVALSERQKNTQLDHFTRRRAGGVRPCTGTTLPSA